MTSVLARGSLGMLSLAFVAACGSTSPSADALDLQLSRAALSVDLTSLLATTDITQLRFSATRVSCAGESFTAQTISRDASLADLALRVEDPELGNRPLAAESEHVFADDLVELDPGCYDITLAPLTSSGAPSQSCAQASQPNVRIFPEATTEIVLVSQCTGDGSSADDATLALNRPPVLSDLGAEDVVEQCQPLTVCVTASDPDGDPIELPWHANAPADTDSIPVTIISTDATAVGGVRQCASITPQSTGTFTYTISAYDTALHDGKAWTIEALLAAAGTPTPSHASVTSSFLSEQSADSATSCAH